MKKSQSKATKPKQRAATTEKQSKNLARTVRAKAVAGAKAAGKAVRKHPYRAAGIAAGVAVLAGAIIARRAKA